MTSHGLNFVELQRFAYLRELIDTKSISEIESIAKFLSDKNPMFVGVACFGIGKLKAHQYINKLILFLNRSDPLILNSACGALAELIDDSHAFLLPRLYELLIHRDILVRMSAINAIKSINQIGSVAILLERLKVESSAAQIQIIDALSELGRVEEIPELLEYLMEVEAMDHSLPDKGGVRGAAVHPSHLKSCVERAIARISERSNIIKE